MQTSPPDRCDSEVFNKGTVVAVLGDIGTEIMEVWVQRVAKESGQRVDWHFSGGRAVVKALGDLQEVDNAAYWCCTLDGKPSTMSGNGRLKDFGGAMSCYGYYPGGENHWSNE